MTPALEVDEGRIRICRDCVVLVSCMVLLLFTLAMLSLFQCYFTSVLHKRNFVL